MIVEKTSGCDHMTCRCGYQFCYICGGKWSSNHKCIRPAANISLRLPPPQPPPQQRPPPARVPPPQRPPPARVPQQQIPNVSSLAPPAINNNRRT
jgi:hypothetical protein